MADAKGSAAAGAGAGDAPEEADGFLAPVVAPRTIDTVVVHPLVLLSVTDHFYRVARDVRNRRVVGVLLGESYKGRVDVTNAFAVPFEEDPKDPSVFFLDHDYLEAMFAMARKVSARERILGFYSTGPKIRPADLALDALFRRYCAQPLLVIVDVRPETEGLPVQAYVTVEHVTEGRDAGRTFAHVPSEVGAAEAEEVGVEHLLRDINDPSVSHLGADVRSKVEGLKGLAARLGDIAGYLERVLAGRIAANNDILYSIQTILALLPNLSVDPLPGALFEVTNDSHLAMYTAALARAVTMLHDLVVNKQRFRDGEAEPKKEGEEGKEGEKKGEEKKGAEDKKAADKADGKKSG